MNTRDHIGITITNELEGVHSLGVKMLTISKWLNFNSFDGIRFAAEIIELGQKILDKNQQFELSILLQEDEIINIMLSWRDPVELDDDQKVNLFFDEFEIIAEDGKLGVSLKKRIPEPRAMPKKSLKAKIRQELTRLSEKELLAELSNRNQKLEAAMELLQRSKEELLNQTQQMANIGGWEIDLADMTVSWTNQVYEIHELPAHFKPTVAEGINFYAPEARPIITQAVENAIANGTSWDLELPFITAKNNNKWVRAIGKPLMEEGKAVRLTGAFQDITERVAAEKELEETMRVMKKQNDRLTNFAHIVSHNLRSHTGNLLTMVSFLTDDSLRTDTPEKIIDYIGNISNTLHSTVEHLTHVVEIQTDLNLEKRPLDLRAYIDRTLSALIAELKTTKAEIVNDITPGFRVQFHPAYLDSVLLNLVSNAIKYRSPERKLSIQFKAGNVDGYLYFSIADNGLGIDLQRHGHKIFGLNKTFHKHPEARGVGLFTTKNQIDALNYQIDVESTPNIGSVFTIKMLENGQ